MALPVIPWISTSVILLQPDNRAVLIAPDDNAPDNGFGMARFEGNPMQFSETSPDNWRSAPLLGEDNAYVFRDILGMEEDEYAELTSEGVI